MADLVTLEDYRRIEGITNTDPDDKLDFIIDSVSQFVRNYCGTEFDAYVASPGFTEEFDIQWDTHIVQLTQSPVIAVDAVYERLGQSNAYTELFSGGTNGKYEWYYESSTDSIIRTSTAGTYKNWAKGVGSVKIQYRAGYATIPFDLKMAVIDLITYYHKDEHKSTQTIGSTTSRGHRISAVPGVTGLPDHIRRVLDMYKDV